MENTGQQNTLQSSLDEVMDDAAQQESTRQESQVEQTTSTGVVSGPPHTHAHTMGQSVSQYVTWLPKLTLPSFSGDPLQFQTFWDSFEAAVHHNNSLTGVQKFHYLRAQLVGDASYVIDNLPLTDVNYDHSVALLKERLGQPYKLVNAHMDALTNLPKLVNNLISLQVFHDKLESHMKSLAVFGQTSRNLLCDVSSNGPGKASHRNQETVHSRPQ